MGGGTGQVLPLEEHHVLDKIKKPAPEGRLPNHYAEILFH
jgi:hypothetical protein